MTTNTRIKKCCVHGSSVPKKALGLFGSIAENPKVDLTLLYYLTRCKVGKNREVRCAIRQVLLCLNRVKKTKLIWLWNTASTYECVRLFSLLQCFATSCEVHLSSMDLSVPQKWMVPISSTVMVISSDMCWRLGPWRLGLDGSTSRNTKLDWTSKRLRHQHVFMWNYTKNVLRRMSNRFWDLFRDGLWIVVLLLTCRLQATVRWPHKGFWPSFWCNMWLIASNYLHVAFKVFWIRQYQMSLAELQFLSPSKDARLINAPYICCIDKNLRCLQEFLRNQTVQLPDSESVRGIDGGKALKKQRHGVILSQHHSFFEVAEKVKSMKSEVGKVIRWLLICFLLVNVFLVYFGVIDWNALCQDQPLYVDVLCGFLHLCNCSVECICMIIYVYLLYHCINF